MLVLSYISNSNFSPIILRYASFIVSGRNEESINAYHLLSARRNLLKIFSITFCSKPDACMAAMKSAFPIRLFFPLRVSASSSLSSGITNAVDSISYAGIIHKGIAHRIFRQRAGSSSPAPYCSLLHHSSDLFMGTAPTSAPKRLSI